jgi:UDP-2,4-diacetamido-2,4,6-trideoxy-beta-L-altropyranose hydrolase
MSTPAEIAFRVDASLEIGNGHVMRCLALAEELSNRGRECRFICRSTQGHPADLILRQGHPVQLLPPPRITTGAAEIDWQADASQTTDFIGGQSPEWLIVDHYGLDHRWEAALAPACERIMAVDDLANRKHACAILLDQNLGRSPADYRCLVPDDAQMLIGPNFALLRHEFAQLRAYSLQRRKEPDLRTILVSMGGTDFTNATSRILKALAHWQGARTCRVVVAMGPHSPWIDEVTKLAAESPFDCIVRRAPPDYAQLMATSDLCFGTAGTTSWERCCLGVPSIVAVVAENQAMLAGQLVASGACLAQLDLNRLDSGFSDLMDAVIMDVGALESASRAAASLCDGSGTRLVSDALIGAAR